MTVLKTSPRLNPSPGFGKGFEIVAHRGVRTLADLSGVAPENTLPAFLQAQERKVAIELDVIATQDGVLVVHHDDETGRVFTHPGGEKTLTKMPYAALAQAKINLEGHQKTLKAMVGPSYQPHPSPLFLDATIPTLEAVLDACPNIHVYIELKTDTANPRKNNNLEARVVKLIQSKNLYDKVTVISFCHQSLKKVKRLDPKIKTGLDYLMPTFLKAFNPWGAGLFLSYCKRILKVDSVHPPYEEVTPALVEKAHRRGLTLTPWVYRQTRQEELDLFPAMEKAGVDGVITNAVDLAQGFAPFHNRSS
ncbi:MAG: hypothetical protein K2X66_01470 [Cyanobacteria bacterium]|nr:hypothetical protein [Cyanobacteriota bacterium]